MGHPVLLGTMNLEAPTPLKQFFDLLDEIGVIR